MPALDSFIDFFGGKIAIFVTLKKITFRFCTQFEKKIP